MATLAPDSPHSSRRARLWMALLVALTLAAVWHAAAAELYARSFAFSTTIPARASSASWAARLEPFNRRYKTRAAVMTGWAEGKRLFGEGEYGKAVDTLAAAYRQDVGDQELLVLFKEAQQALSFATTGIAHVQHGLDPSLTPPPHFP